ncbi:MAG: arginine--tRNA ligase [Minisyncoccota bacterium]
MKEKIRQLLKEAIYELGTEFVSLRSDFIIERPKDDRFGEYTSNIALVAYTDSAHAINARADENAIVTQEKINRENPISLANQIKEKIENKKSDLFERINVAGPGHINFYLSKKSLIGVVQQILKEAQAFGNNNSGKEMKVNNEFISANPTGPLHLGNARGGFYADTLSRILRKSGYEVTNEYYINDAGEQVLKLGHSVIKDDEAVYGGTYIDELNERFGGGDVAIIGQKSAEYVLEKMIKKSVDEKMHIHFDIWTSEKDIVAGGYVEKAIALLQEKNLIFENEGAVWLRTTDFGDDKDRVLVKKDGTRTYFASDCGYILHKMERGFDRLIETWGADHHGYVARFRASTQALGFIGKVDFILVQMVKVVKDGQEVRMSKRAGNVITVDELIDMVGHDVARFFFLLYAPETHMNFDLGLAEERSRKNPVFYIQYAYARLCNILRKADEEGFVVPEADLSLLVHQKERGLIRELLFFPELIEKVAEDFSVHSLPQYAMRLADKFHSFYDECRVLDTENMALTGARLELIHATKNVLGETFSLMGISAPETM